MPRLFMDYLTPSGRFLTIAPAATLSYTLASAGTPWRVNLCQDGSAQEAEKP